MKQRNALAIVLAAFSLGFPALAASASDEIAARGPIQLTMRRAIQLATSPEGSTRIQLQMENVKQAKDRAVEVRASLLPDVESYVGMISSVRSLSSQGLSSIPIPSALVPILDAVEAASGQPPLPGGVLPIPSRTAPFYNLDARGTANAVAFDLSLIRRFQASRSGVKAAKEDMNTTDDQVTGQVARAYLNALRMDAQVEATQADMDLSEAVLKQAQHQKDAGAGTGIDVTRANVQLANDKQRVFVAKNDQTKAHLQLLRAMNMRLDAAVELVDKLVYKPVDTLSTEDAIAQAMANRPDLKAQLQREDASRLNASSVKYERLPSIVTSFDYGVIGPQDVHLVPTRDYYGSLRIPIFDGGRRDARRAESASQLRQERVRTADLRDQIELDIRTSLDSLKSAADQVEVAEEGLKLAETELAQARRRYDAGVAGSLEVADASDRVQRARINEISAVFNHNLARIDFGQALGKTISMID